MAIIQTSDGSHTVFSEQFGVPYHSKHGAVKESAHVFIAMGLLHKAQAKRELAILEAGFGSGLNAFMTWLSAEEHHLKVTYCGLEKYPISPLMADDFNFAKVLGVPSRHLDFMRLHQMPWNCSLPLSPVFSFEKRLQLIETIDILDFFDIVYFDAFAPRAQPELWEEPILERYYNALKIGGVLVSYCAKGEFKRRLKRVGFTVERLPGPAGKREMTRAAKF